MLRRRFYFSASVEPVPYVDAQPGDILCSDRTILRAEDYPRSGKVPIGVVFANIFRMIKVIALNEVTVRNYGWSSVNQAIEGLPFVVSNPEKTQKNGAVNSMRIINGSYGNNGNQLILAYTAAGLCYQYSTEGTKVGDWSLFSVFEKKLLDRNFQFVMNALGILGATVNTSGLHWTSQHVAENAAFVAQINGSRLNGVGKQTTTCRIRPYLNLPYTAEGEVPYEQAAVGDILCSDWSVVRRQDYTKMGKLAIGIVFSKELTQFSVMGLTFGTSKQWGVSTNVVSGVPTYSDSEEAWNENSDARENTNALIAAGFSHADYAAGWCRGYQTEGTESGDWDFISTGEMRTISFSMSLLNHSLSIVGGTLLAQSTYYWTSAQQGMGYAWIVKNSNAHMISKTGKHTVIPAMKVEF